MTGLLLVGLAVLYFAPAIIGFRRECKSSVAIFVFNLLLGWTALGMLVALAWALGGRIRGSIWPTEVVMRVRVIERTPDPQ
jgi:Superinfection immunity protein